MARLDDLEFVITANTTALRGDLARGTEAVNAFATKTEASLSHHQASLEHITRSIRHVIELYGILSLVEGFGRHIEEATQLNKLTQEQADKLAGARSEMEKLSEAWERLLRVAAIKGSGFFETVARGARRTLDDVSGGPQDKDSRLTAIQQQIAEANTAIQTGKTSFLGVDVELSAKGVAAYRAKLDELWESFKQVQAGASDADKTIGQLEWEKKLEGLQEIVLSVHKTTSEGLFRGLGIGELKRAAEIAEQLKTPLEKDLEALREIRNLVADDALKPDAVTRFADQKLQEIDLSEITGKFKEFKPAIDDAEKSAKKFADSFTASLDSRGIDALVNGDVDGALKGLAQDFVELIIKMTLLKPLAESLEKSFMKIGKSQGLLGFLGAATSIGTSGDPNIYPGAGPADLFPGFAGGGRPNVGQPAWFGEDGPELWVPDVAGRVLSNAESRSAMGGGTNLYLTQNIQAGLPPQWDVQLAAATRIAATVATEAATKSFTGRR